MTNYKEMHDALMSVPYIEHDTDKPISIWLGSLAAYNDGVLLGRWISLPTDEDALQAAYDIVTEDGAHDFFIADHEGVYKDIHESSSPFELNRIAELFEDMTETEQEIAAWLVKDVGYDIDDVLDEELYRSVDVGSKDDLTTQYIEMKFDRDIRTHELFQEIVGYIDWDYVWREIEISATTHYNGNDEYFVYWQ